MNFFQSLSELGLKGDLRINITHTEDQRMVASLVLVPPKGAGESQKTVKPLLIRGTPEELDANFFPALATPLQSVSEFYCNAGDCMKALEPAKRKTLPAKPETARTDAEKKTDKYNAQMKTANDLEKEGKFREAWMKVPSIEDYPDQEAEIRARREALSAQFAPSLFS